MSRSYPHLMSAGRIGSMTLKNRIIMSPMGSNLAEADGFCGERIARYYAARAEGGAAMVIMGSTGVAWPRGSGNQAQVAVSDDRFIPGLKAVADAVHAHDGRIAMQLQHAGAIAVNEPLRGWPLLVPSIPEDKPFDWPVDLTPQENKDMFEAFFAPGVVISHKVADEDDLEWVIDSFAQAAIRARKAGMDGVEIHAGHGYLISGFLSPVSNQRNDRWGGSLENRARLLVEVIKRIRAATGPDFPVWFRFDSQEYLLNEGITLQDAIATARLAEAAGADAVHVSANADKSKGISFTEGHATHFPGNFLSNAAAIKAALSIPVICPGRIEPELGEEMIAAGKLDFIAMARKLLADPELPNKLKAGRPELVRPCIYCYTCISQIFLGAHLRCAVNAQTGYELSAPIIPIAAQQTRKKVMVIGGGPGGMEAARVAALRGHDVSLHEASGRLGGTVFFSSIVYPENGRLIEYLARQMDERKVKVHLRSRVTEDTVRRAAPDVVIVATGAQRNLMSLPGSDLPHVFSGDEMREMVTGKYGQGLKRKLPFKVRAMIQAGSTLGLLDNAATIRRMSEFYLPLGKEVVIYGGGLVGVELAEFLAERHRKVTVIEPGPSFGKELMMVRRWRLMDTLRKEKVVLLQSSELLEITPDSVVYRTRTGQVQTRKADTVIMAIGAEPSGAALTSRLKSVCKEVHCIGDAQELGYIDGAIKTGNRLALTI
jgi:2,4-dienoyl-CoA reductase-like NADH-dependent reductase (Old Yellow Enzyme family)/NADPH-dependent 2,4-dienoyl-CoA reductase/sulfur reductase-like enzyme